MFVSPLKKILDSGRVCSAAEAANCLAMLHVGHHTTNDVNWCTSKWEGVPPASIQMPGTVRNWLDKVHGDLLC